MRNNQPWTPGRFAVLLLMLGVCAWTHRAPLRDVLDIGLSDAEQSHIFLVPFIAVWLLWLRRSRTRCVKFRPSAWGLLIVPAGYTLSWWGFQTGTQIAWHAGAGLSLVGVLFSMTGLEPLRQFAPVFGALVFALPVPGVFRQMIGIPLQAMATAVTQATLELFGVAATRMGNVLLVNGEQIAVGEACNGMRMVFAFFLVVYAFAFSSPLKLATRSALLLLSPAIALACNVIRLVPTSVIYGYDDASRAEGFHAVTGWIMLPVALLILVSTLRLFKWLELPVTPFRLALR